MTERAGAALSAPRGGLWALATASCAALLASSCCLIPLLLVLAGFSGAWMARFRLMAPYSPWLTAVSVVALVLSWRGVIAPRSTCDTARRSTVHRLARPIFWITAVVTAVLLLAPLAAPLFY